jgi:hypothetical protein
MSMLPRLYSRVSSKPCTEYLLQGPCKYGEVKMREEEKRSKSYLCMKLVNVSYESTSLDLASVIAGSFLKNKSGGLGRQEPAESAESSARVLASRLGINLALTRFTWRFGICRMAFFGFILWSCSGSSTLEAP